MRKDRLRSCDWTTPFRAQPQQTQDTTCLHTSPSREPTPFATLRQAHPAKANVSLTSVQPQDGTMLSPFRSGRPTKTTALMEKTPLAHSSNRWSPNDRGERASRLAQPCFDPPDLYLYLLMKDIRAVLGTEKINAIDLPAADDEVHVLLNRYNLATPLGHLDQAITAHTRGDWAAANGQSRSFIESLLDEDAYMLVPNPPRAPNQGIARREALPNMQPPYISAYINVCGN